MDFPQTRISEANPHRHTRSARRSKYLAPLLSLTCLAIVVRYQHKFYVPLAIVLGFVVPSLLAYSWNDFFGGVLYAGHVAKIVIWHSTFCINSFAHWLGSQDFSLEHTARGSLVLAVLTQGEGINLVLTFTESGRASQLSS